MKSQARINQVRKHTLKKKVTNINILNFYTNSKFFMEGTEEENK